MRQRLYLYLISLAILLLYIMSANAQHFGSPGTQTPVFRNLNNGIPYGYYEYLPQNYDTAQQTNKQYAVVIFFGGVGELGNGTTDLTKLLKPDAPPRIIKEGRHFPAIVISAQHSGWFDEPQSKELYDYILNRYPVDPDRVYVTGLSAGGAATWKFARAYPQLPAAIVPIAGATQYKSLVPQLQDMPIWAFHNVLDGCGGGGVPSVWTMLNCDMIAGISASVRNVYPGGWGYCVTAGYDVTMHFMDGKYWSANSGANAPSQKMAITMYDKPGHGGWSTVYRSQYMWNWLFSQTRATVDSLIVDAGSDVSGVLPTNKIILKGSAYSLLGTSISGYLWTKESGPNVTMSGISTSDLTLTNLQAGEYRFRLTATDVNAKTAFDEVKVYIKSPPTSEAGNNQNLVLPQDSTNLYGNASADPDGFIMNYEWKLISSPSVIQVPDTDTTLIPLDTNSYKVMINFTPASLTAAAPWNNINGSIYAGTHMTNMLDDEGNATDMDLELLTTWNGSKTGGKVTGNNSGVYPDDVMDGFYWFQHKSPKIKISDLDTGKTYHFTFFGSRTGWGLNKTTIYKIGTKMVSLNAAENTSDVVTISDVKPNAAGEVFIDLEIPAGGTYGYLNAMEVESVSNLKGAYKTLVTITPPASSSNSTTDSSLVYVNFTPASLQVGGPWNNFNGNVGKGTGITDMKDNKGVTTEMDIELKTSWNGSKTGGKTTGNNSGVFPDNILDGFYWFQNGTQVIKVSDLDTTMTYDFTLMGSRTGWGLNKTTVYRIGNKVDSLNAADNTTDVVELKDITPNKYGEVFIEVTRGHGSSYAYLNAMVIKAKSSAPAAVTILNADQPVATVTGLQEGTYTFELTVIDNDGYTDKDTVAVVVNGGGSLRIKPEEPEQESVDVNEDITYSFYPNPASEYLNVKLSRSEQFTIRIFNTAGQQFAPYIEKNNDRAIIDVSKLQTGYYIIQVIGEKNSKAERVFVAPR